MRRRYPALERRELDRATFEREHLATGTPVVIAGTDAGFCARWSLDALREAHGDRRIDAEYTRSVYVGGRTTVRTDVRGICERVSRGDRSLRWKGLAFDFDGDPPPTDGLLPRGTTARRRTLWVAPRGTMSSLHHDGDSDNLNLQVSGRKLFVLVPPRFVREVYLQGTAESPVNPFTPDLRRFPRFADAPAFEAMLEPGDALFIPKYWLHCVYAAAPSVNVNTWFDWEREASAWSALAGAPLGHRALVATSATMKRHGLRRLAATCGQVFRRFTEPLEPDPRGELVDA